LSRFRNKPVAPDLRSNEALDDWIIMLGCVRANTNATVMMMAEYGADLFKQGF
jgi:hypothetical protein